jgi:hypothetical protein
MSVLKKNDYGEQDRNLEHVAKYFSYKLQSDFKIMLFDNQPKCSLVIYLLGRVVLVGFQKKIRYREKNVSHVEIIVTCDNMSYSISKQCSLKQMPNAPGIDLVFDERGILVRT